MNRTLLYAQREIAALWFGFALVHVVVLFGQTYLGNVFIAEGGEDLSKQAWQWWLPQVAPTLGLVLGVLANLELVATAQEAARTRVVSSFFLRLTFAISTFYLIVVLALELLVAVKSNASQRVAMLQGANYILGPLQALLGGAMGVFFISSHSAAIPPAVLHKPVSVIQPVQASPSSIEEPSKVRAQHN